MDGSTKHQTDTGESCLFPISYLLSLLVLLKFKPLLGWVQVPGSFLPLVWHGQALSPSQATTLFSKRHLEDLWCFS